MHLTQVQHLKTFPSSDDDLQPNNETSLESNNRIFWQVEWLLSRNEEATLAACSSDRIIRMFPSSNSLPVLLTNAHTKTIRCITFSSDAKLLAAGSFDSTISIWKRSGDSSSFTWKCISTLQGHDSEVKDVSFSFDDSFLASCGRDKSIWVWSVQYEGEDEDFDIQSHSLLTDHSQDVKCVKWHPSMMLFASASYDNTIKIFAADEDDEFNCVATLLGHTETAWRVEFIPKHNLLVSASSDSTIKFWKMPQDISQNWNCLHSVVVGNGMISGPFLYTLAIFHDQFIAVGTSHHSILVYELPQESSSSEEPPALIEVISEAHLGEINDLAWNQTTGTLASCSDDGTIKYWQFIE